MSKVILTRPSRAFGVIGISFPRPRKAAATEAPSSISAKATTTVAASKGTSVMPYPLAFIPTTTSLPELVREFEQIQTKLRSPRCLSKPQNLQDQRRVFREWMEKDFTAFFSFKAFQGAERDFTNLY